MVYRYASWPNTVPLQMFGLKIDQIQKSGHEIHTDLVTNHCSTELEWFKESIHEEQVRGACWFFWRPLRVIWPKATNLRQGTIGNLSLFVQLDFGWHYT
ncbi:AKR_collapsed_G0026020.mRNA.1.CDS.1 [Saccharomyces cerevisiae]|nr:AKR_collapsed_G0026020.mRNA.1.CDS.1 [Saccharomyces cerevisiae]